MSSGQIDLYKTRDVAAEDAEKAKRDAAREEERMIGESFHNITELMFNLRREFVVDLTPTDCKKGFPAIARYMACAADDNFDLDLTLIGNILGVELSQEFVDSSGKDWYKILDEDGVYGTMPERCCWHLPILRWTAAIAVTGVRTGMLSARNMCTLIGKIRHWMPPMKC